MSASHQVIAVSADTAVVHWNVSFGGTEMDGVLVIRFDEYGACCEHREWYVERTAGGSDTR